ncbi:MULTISPECIES: hypothetical protein [Prochlorococcus]|uniref:Uncharacterized protein n=1 Tax=Prochlorococcus marinus (strain SARG / CCMP1375 / SS120) TaxID=167539 RepID=Q7VCU9_PROMA|nr:MULTISPECIES: hypothetical protein [Prochlorococcus]AAP99685.1 Predicted protein [Prochlorococcus marinus subsp. marinus str. CCMP1375]
MDSSLQCLKEIDIYRRLSYLLMFTLITVLFSLFFIGLTGWTIITYLVKEDSQKYIKEELDNLFDISKMLFLSLKGLIGVLAKHSFSSDSVERTSNESQGIDDQLLKMVTPVEAVEEDTALSSFSPELIEVITEEEEKVA